MSDRFWDYRNLPALALLIASQSALAALPTVEIMRTDQPLETSSAEMVSNRLASPVLTDSDGYVLSGDLWVTFDLNADSANTYNVNGQTIAPGGNAEFTFDFSATNGKLDIPVYVEGAGTVSEDDYSLSINVPGLVVWEATLPSASGDVWSFRDAWFGSDGKIYATFNRYQASERPTSSAFSLVSFDQDGTVTPPVEFEQVDFEYPKYVGQLSNGDFVLSRIKFSETETLVIAPDGTERFEIRHHTLGIDPATQSLLYLTSPYSSGVLSRLGENGSPGPTASYWPPSRKGFGFNPFSNGLWGMVLYDDPSYGSTAPSYTSYSTLGGVTRKWFKQNSGLAYVAKTSDVMWGGPKEHFLTSDGVLRHYSFTGDGLPRSFSRFALASTETEFFRAKHSFDPIPGMETFSIIRLAKDGSYVKASKGNICQSASFGEDSVHEGLLIAICGGGFGSGRVLKLINLNAETKFTDVSAFEGMQIVPPDEESSREAATWSGTFTPYTQDNVIGTNPSSQTITIVRP